MRKTNLFLKYLNNISKSINSLLEKNLNKLNIKNFSYLLKNNKIILTFVALFVLFISYLLLPTFYKHDDISQKLKTDLKRKFDINFNFSQDIKYSFFPRPHFTITDSTVSDHQNEISKIKKIRIYLSIDNFFSLKNVQIKDLVLDNANFNLNKKNYNFFFKILNKSFKNGNFIVKNSNIFFRNFDDEVLFVNKILKMKYYFDKKELRNIFYSKNEIFNIPFTMETYFNQEKSKIFSKLNLDMINLKIENELTLNNEKKIGRSELVFNKIKQSATYQIEKTHFNFHIFDKLDQPDTTFKARFNLKPFYASLKGKIHKINLQYLFGSNAIIAQLLKTEIFNNKNIEFNLNINAENIYNNFNFKNIEINSKIHEGLIDVDNSKFEWKNFVNFELSETLIFVKDGELVLDGKLIINITDYNEVYKFLLTPKNYRSEIKQIDLNFNYNFDKKNAELKDIKIDNKINQNINRILNNVILKKDDLQNKIYFKNLLNDALKSYAG